MVAIEPVMLWEEGKTKMANVFILIMVYDDLINRAQFYYRLGFLADAINDNSNPVILQDGNLTMHGQAYEDWDNTPSMNEYAYNWAAMRLNLTII